MDSMNSSIVGGPLPSRRITSLTFTPDHTSASSIGRWTGRVADGLRPPARAVRQDIDFPACPHTCARSKKRSPTCSQNRPCHRLNRVRAPRLRNPAAPAPSNPRTKVQKVESRALPSNNQRSRLARDTKLLAGLVKNQASLPTLTIGGKTYTPPQCVAVLQSRVDLGNLAVTAKGAFHKAVQDSRSEDSSTKDFVDGLVTTLLVVYMNAPDALADYGLSPKKKNRGPKTVEAKMVAAAKRDATRKLRHTMGSKQKESVKATVSSVAVDVPQPVLVASSNGPTGSAAQSSAPAQGPSNGPSPAPAPAPKGSQP